jgi:hypothetical protein
MSRLSPLDPPYDPAVEEQLARMMPAGAEPIALFRLFVRNLPMARAMSGWGTYELSRELSLSLREREIVIDRTCARGGCEYEWGVHVAIFAERAALDADQVRSLTVGGADDPCWPDPREQLLIRVGDALWHEASRRFTDAELLDLVMLCGWYQAISQVARVTRIANEPGTPTFAAVDVVGAAGQDAGKGPIQR